LPEPSFHSEKSRNSRKVFVGAINVESDGATGGATECDCLIPIHSVLKIVTAYRDQGPLLPSSIFGSGQYDALRLEHAPLDNQIHYLRFNQLEGLRI